MDPRTPLLPDPTADLHWSDFRGSIQDIFESNALKHPEKLCVIETSSTSSPRREFTYRQINEASNILAHHLVQSGVKRSEVVTVYAHRGVDLPVAVMGILKAGATFSVIDPAYPPDRQVIYLDVARPRALIVIEKASQEAGKLTDTVRSYIDNNLNLRTEVPGLMLEGNGTLVGGVVNGRDAFFHCTTLAAHSPGIVVGPDSTPTLSFTSGSEGRPKGVKGRHFSLAYYFDWMAATFDLTEHDRFTMLSGIAHDPIQRDIFTPLFLSACILVPSGDDIQHELLAEWMRREKATVTHLTPAMGNILAGGATAIFPSLHYAFFVGDVLITRDCRRLQELAPNVSIVNMYGTTETQRAVSYFQIPSRNLMPNFLDTMGPVIPAGKGMKDVQLLVVDRVDRTRLCDIGEIGEIYVRAAGLAEGYLGDDLAESTRLKFVQNWFVDGQKWIDLDNAKVAERGEPEPWRQFYHGPRDRLYRSGDLGKYTPTGDVECTGRADNQVQIKGFRIELGEIDTYLSQVSRLVNAFRLQTLGATSYPDQHAIVRENVTLLRRQEGKEPTLVSYIVPDLNKWQEWQQKMGNSELSGDDSMIGLLRRFGTLCDHVRDYLRTKLAAYAVPTHFVPLLRMPLNPNGKIDRAALPFPETAELNAAATMRRLSMSSAAKSPTEIELSEIWANRLPQVAAAQLIQPEDSFSLDLGGDSVLVSLMLYDVRKRWKGVHVSLNMYFRAPSLREFASKIDQALDSIRTGSSSDGHKEDDTRRIKNYADDAAELVKLLPETFGAASEQNESSTILTVFITGASGFLGANILSNLLLRKNNPVKLMVHIRATHGEAPEKLKRACQAYSSWSDSWWPRLELITEEIDIPTFNIDGIDGMATKTSRTKTSLSVWTKVARDADVIIHNAAKVHWMKEYSNLKNANVISTLNMLALCATGKPKRFAFVSSTSVLDTAHYVALSKSGNSISEDDALEGSRRGLATGYGQSKWVSEYLVREAGRRGLRGSIIRPGYVLGDSKTGVTNTDDFLVRMLKACVQLHSAPDIDNTINMVPVDRVARIVVASALFPPVSPLGVAQVSGSPRMTFRNFLGALQTYGYDVSLVEYHDKWRQSIENHHEGYNKANQLDFPLIGLADFVQNDLPANTKAPELSDTNASRALLDDARWSGVELSDNASVTEALMGRYLSYLVAIGFLPSPPNTNRSKPLPQTHLSDEHKQALGMITGRGAQRPG